MESNNWGNEKEINFNNKNQKIINKNEENQQKIKPDGLGKAGAILLIISGVFGILLGILFLVFIFGIILIVIGILGIVYGSKFLGDYKYKTHAIVFSCLALSILPIIFCAISKKGNEEVVYVKHHENESNIYDNKSNDKNIKIDEKNDEDVSLTELREKLELQERTIKNLEDKAKKEKEKD